MSTESHNAALHKEINKRHFSLQCICHYVNIVLLVVAMVKHVQKRDVPRELQMTQQSLRIGLPERETISKKQVPHSMRTCGKVLSYCVAAGSPAFSREATQDDLPCPDSQQWLMSKQLFPPQVIHTVLETTKSVEQSQSKCNSMLVIHIVL